MKTGQSGVLKLRIERKPVPRTKVPTMARPSVLYFPLWFMMRPRGRGPTEVPMDCGMRQKPAWVAERPLA